MTDWHVLLHNSSNYHDPGKLPKIDVTDEYLTQGYNVTQLSRNTLSRYAYNDPIIGKCILFLLYTKY